MKTPEFMQDATNVYRTKEYIVKQAICFHSDMKYGEVLISFDTYYKRNAKRDEEYRTCFLNRRRINGKRLSVSMYTRTYVQ